MIGHFLTVLMQVLMHKSHDLLKEEIILAAFHMANVDFGTVHVLTEQFLPWRDKYGWEMGAVIYLLKKFE